MKALLWTSTADGRLRSELESLVQANPVAAERLATHIDETTKVLQQFPEAGALLGHTQLRKFAVPRTDFLLLYRNAPDAIRIIAMYHGREDWQTKHPRT